MSDRVSLPHSLTHSLSLSLDSLGSLAPWLLPALGSGVAGVAAYHCYLLARFPGEAKVEWTFVPILGHALAFGKDPIGTVQKLSRQSKTSGHSRTSGKCPIQDDSEAHSSHTPSLTHSPLKEVVGVLLAGQRIFLVNDPASFKVIFKPRPELSFTHFANDVLIKVFGATPDVVHGTHAELAPHVHTSYQRHLLSDQGCSILTDRMQEKLAALVSNTQHAEGKATKVVDLLDFVNRLVYRSSAAALFNESLADSEELYQKFLAFDDMFAMALAGVPLSFFPDGLSGREALLEKLTKFRDDISEFMEFRFGLFIDKGHPDRDVAANQLALLWASVGNTMPATFWVVYYMMSHPEALAAVKDEVRNVLGDKVEHPDDLMVSQAELDGMVVLDSIISETLRLSSGSLIMRRVTEACTLTLSSGNTYKFRKGDSVGIFPPVVHRDESLHDSPEKFVFDRFVAGQCPAMKHLANGQRIPASSCMIPFGGGASYCPGRKFARAEIKALVAQILVRFDMQFEDPLSAVEEPKVDLSRAGLGVFQPKDCHIKVKLTPK